MIYLGTGSCLLNAHKCEVNERCVDTETSFECRCENGFQRLTDMQHHCTGTSNQINTQLLKQLIFQHFLYYIGIEKLMIYCNLLLEK